MLPRLSFKKGEGRGEGPAAALSPQGQALVEEVDLLAEEVLAPEKEEPAPMTRRQAGNMRRTANGFYAGAVALFLLLGVTLLLNTFWPGGVFGLRFFVEPTNAMLRQVPRGSLLVTVMRPSGKIKPGDIVTYNARYGEPDTRLTRIVAERLESNGQTVFRTKRAGDAAPDSMPITMSYILGVKLAVLPGMGYVVSFMRDYAWGLAILAAMLLVSAAAMRRWANMEHPDLKKKKKRKSMKRKGRVRHAII